MTDNATTRESGTPAGEPHGGPAAGVRRRLRRTVVGLVAGLGLCAVLAVVLTPRIVRAELTRRLHGDDPEWRRRAAWALAERGDERALAHIAAQLGAGSEPVVQVREAFVYALSFSERRAFADLLAETALTDPSAYVRQAAWVALSKLDDARFREAAANPDRPAEAWDQIGLGNGFLLQLDMRGVDDLLFWAVAGDEAQRLAASKGLARGVALALEAVGRWPLDARVELDEPEPWPPDFVAEIKRRCAGLDLQAIADDGKPHAERIAHVRRNVARLHHTRDRIVNWLFDS